MYNRLRTLFTLGIGALILFPMAARPQSVPSAPATTHAGTSASTPVVPESQPRQMPAESTPSGVGGKTAATKASGGGRPETTASPDIEIGSGDLLEIAVFGAPDFSKQVRVSSSGEVSLPLIGTVKVAGLTTGQAEKLVEKQLLNGGYFTDPHVSIFEKEYQTQGISVLGEVQKPGIYPMLGSRRLLDVIAAAGGTTPKAGNQVSIAHRDQSRPVQTLTLKSNESDSTNNNPEVFPGDTVVVQKAGIVYVVGDVRMPGGFVMDKPQLTVLQALAMAQGANPTAKLDGARLIRKNGDQRQELPIELKKILASKSPDVSLQADDILFVPNSAAKSAMRHGLETILQAATGVAIYH